MIQFLTLMLNARRDEEKGATAVEYGLHGRPHRRRHHRHRRRSSVASLNTLFTSIDRRALILIFHEPRAGARDVGAGPLPSS